MCFLQLDFTAADSSVSPSLPPCLFLSLSLKLTTNKLRRCRPLDVLQYMLAYIGAPLQPVGPERGVGGRWWIKDGRTEGARGREACGSLPGRCDGRFNLSIPPCPQQLSETEGLKTPRAEAHKSRLGWSKKAEEEEGLEGGDRGDASSQIWSTRPPSITGPRDPPGGGGELPDNWLSRLASLQQMPPFGLLCCCLHRRTGSGIFMARAPPNS